MNQASSIVSFETPHLKDRIPLLAIFRPCICCTCALTSPERPSPLPVLAAAKQFHCTQPDRPLAIFESEAPLGGTWADHRLYPGLGSNNLLVTYEYPDFPMDAKFGVKPNEHIPGAAVNKYLKASAEQFGIANKVRLRTKVLGRRTSGSGRLDLDPCQPRTESLCTQTHSGHWPHFGCFPGAICWSGHFRRKSFAWQEVHAESRYIAARKMKSRGRFGCVEVSLDAVYADATAGVKSELDYTTFVSFCVPEGRFLSLT